MIRSPIPLQWPEADPPGQREVVATLVADIEAFVHSRSWSRPPGILIVMEPPPRVALEAARRELEERGDVGFEALRWGTKGRGRAWSTNRLDGLGVLLSHAFAVRSDHLYVMVDDAIDATTAASIIQRELTDSRARPGVSGMLGFEWGALRESWP